MAPYLAGEIWEAFSLVLAVAPPGFRVRLRVHIASFAVLPRPGSIRPTADNPERRKFLKQLKIARH